MLIRLMHDSQRPSAVGSQLNHISQVHCGPAQGHREPDNVHAIYIYT
jgi:hypothetical protein